MPSRRSFLIVIAAALVLSVGVTRAKEDDSGDEGWTRLGKADFGSEAREKDVVASILRGGWRFVRLKVIDADAKIDSVTAVYASGRDVDLKVKDTIKAGKQSRPIALSGGDRPLKKITIKARSGDPARKSLIEVWVKSSE